VISDFVINVFAISVLVVSVFMITVFVISVYVINALSQYDRSGGASEPLDRRLWRLCAAAGEGVLDTRRVAGLIGSVAAILKPRTSAKK
jgi:hypothetical protein